LFLPDRRDIEPVEVDFVDVAAHESPEAVVLTEFNSALLIPERLTPAAAAILPVLDISGPFESVHSVNAAKADVQVLRSDKSRLRDGLLMIMPLVERARDLPPSVFLSEDPRVRLMARLVVRDRALEPKREASVKSTVVYPDECAIPNVAQHAEDLVDHGLMARSFRDATVACPQCASSRISVRERCSSCGSANLHEEPVLHHYRCAHQALEHAFRHGDALICPKCRSALEYFGVDYSRPAMVALCARCGHISGETSVGFLCLDCELDSDEGAICPRPIYAYELTEAGRDYVAQGAELPPEPSKSLVPSRISNFAWRHIKSGAQYCLLSVELQGPASHTRFRFHTMSLLLQLIRETFIPETEVVEDGAAFLVLLANDSEGDVAAALPGIQASWEKHLTWPHGLRIKLHGRDEIPLICQLQS